MRFFFNRRSKACRLAAATFFAIGSLAAVLRADETLTLAQAVQRALANNPELAVDVPARSAARSLVNAARAAYLPRIDFEQSYTGSNNPVYVFGTLLSQGRFTQADFDLRSLNSPSALDNLQTRFSARQTLWDAGRTRRAVDSAQLELEITDRGSEDHQRRILLGVLDAYLALSSAREADAAARVELESAEAIVGQAKARVESGLAVEADALRARAHVSMATQHAIQAKGLVDVARARLNYLMGAPIDEAQGATAPLAAAHYEIPEEARLLADQRQHRPDYQRLLVELRRAELEIGLRRAEFLPSLGSFASWEADNPSLRRAGNTNWTAGIQLRWNISSGGADAARLQAARHRTDQVRKQIVAMESGMAVEIRQAVVECRAANQLVEAAASAETESIESLRILRNRYQSGLATMTDVLAAESARAAARTAMADAVYRQHIGLGRLEYAAGILSPTSAAMRP